MQRFKAIVFDLDDTLFPERDYVLSGFRAVAAWVEGRLSVPADVCYEELRIVFDSGCHDRTFDRWLFDRGLDPALYLAEFMRIYREHSPRLELEPQVLELLVGLRSRYRLGLVSDGAGAVQRKKVEALGLSSYLDAMVFSDELGREHWKPSVRPFEVVLESLGVSGSEAVYVADNPKKDFLGARRAGMTGVRLINSAGLHRLACPESAEHAPDADIERISQLEDFLEVPAVAPPGVTARSAPLFDGGPVGRDAERPEVLRGDVEVVDIGVGGSHS